MTTRISRSVRLSAEPVATIRIHIIPNAKIDKVVGERGGVIKIKLRAPAVEGKANTALRCFLAEELNVPQRSEVARQDDSYRWVKGRGDSQIPRTKNLNQALIELRPRC